MTFDPQQERLAFIRARILKIRTAILALPVGVSSINREGFSAGYDLKAAYDELDRLENEEKEITG